MASTKVSGRRSGRGSMRQVSVHVAAADPDWARQFERVAGDLWVALSGVPVEAIEHVGSTSVPGLAAKPILDIDILVLAENIPVAIGALEAVGYVHRGDLGITGREAFYAPDQERRRHVYLSTPDNLHIRNHLAVRDVLRARPDLREEYAAVKLALAAEPGMDIDTYIARKSAVLQTILSESQLSEVDRRAIFALNREQRGGDLGRLPQAGADGHTDRAEGDQDAQQPADRTGARWAARPRVAAGRAATQPRGW